MPGGRSGSPPWGDGRDQQSQTEPSTAGTGPAGAITVDGLSKRFGEGDTAVQAVDDVSFSVEAGTAVGLLGPNGAGKTTTIKCLLGLVQPTAGGATVAGVDVHDDPRAAYRSVGAMLEGARNVYWRLTVAENVDFFAALGGRRPREVRERRDDLLRQFGLADRSAVPVSELSRGMKQKASLACTLARDPAIVFLDEPTLGLDVESSLEMRRELRRLVDEEARTVIVSSHDMDTIEVVCDRVIIMGDGSVVADERVDDLLELFRTQAYEVRLEGSLVPADREGLEDRFAATDFRRRDGREQFVAHVAGDEFYDLADYLRSGGYTVDAVDPIEPDLEEVFLDITGEHRAARGGRAG